MRDVVGLYVDPPAHALDGTGTDADDFRHQGGSLMGHLGGRIGLLHALNLAAERAAYNQTLIGTEARRELTACRHGAELGRRRVPAEMPHTSRSKTEILSVPLRLK